MLKDGRYHCGEMNESWDCFLHCSTIMSSGDRNKDCLVNMTHPSDGKPHPDLGNTKLWFELLRIACLAK